MGKVFLLLFAAVAAVVVLGADYYTRMQKAPEGLTLSQYVASWSDRSAEASAEARPARSLLPAAPEGWQRVAWTEALEQEMNPPRALSGFERDVIAGLQTNPQASALAQAHTAALIRRKAETTWVYRKGDEIVFVSVSDRGAAKGGLSQTDSGFAVVQGLPYFEKYGAAPLGPPSANARRQFSAQLGDRFALTVMARAEESSVRALLDQIDVDALNAQLASPVAGIGRAAPKLNLSQQVATANQRLVALRREQGKGPASDAFGPAGLEQAVASVFRGSKTAAFRGDQSGVTAFVPAAKPVKSDDIQINRPTVKKLAKKAACGGGNFCKVSN